MLGAADVQFDEEQKALLKSYQKKPKNCAEDLDEPPSKRDLTTFVGLKNQGATCYLNSLLQSVYMIPEFRHAILSLPLCIDNDIKQPSSFVSQSKFNFLFPLQKLFAELKELDIKATVTEEVTTAFGWNNNEQQYQHDIQEAYRIIFDILERALEGTEYGNWITNNFRGVQVNHIECLSCGNVKDKESDFYDLIVPVKGIETLEESLLSMLNMERLEGPNQYDCDSCNKKADALKGIRIRKYPPILTFSLSRFDFDLEKLQRVKINSKFTFGAELDVSVFAEMPQNYATEDEKIYELCAVIIHRGDAFGGHYKAYIRDNLKEGDWGGMSKANGVVVANGERGSEEKKNGESAEGSHKLSAEEQKILDDIANKDTTDDEAPKKEANKPAKTSKNKKNKKKRNRNRKSNDHPPTEKKDNNNKGKNEEENDKYDTVYDKVDFPFKFKNEDLKFHWFDFDDSTVKPIPMNRIQFQFGGTLENAYILIYRQRALNKNLEAMKTQIPKYLQKDIDDRNEFLEVQRIVYNEAANNIECLLINPDQLDLQNRVYKPDFSVSAHSKRLRIRLDAPIEEMLGETVKLFSEFNSNPEEIVIIEITESSNKLLHFKREIHAAFKDVTISDAKIEHLSTFLVFPNKSHSKYKMIANRISEDALPIRVNARYLGQDLRLLAYKNELFGNLRLRFSELFEFPLEFQYIVLMKQDGPQNITKDPDNDEKDLASLGVTDNADFILSKIEEAKLQDFTKIKTKAESRKEKIQENKILSSKTENLTSVLIESDGKTEAVRYYVELDWTLRDLVQNVKKKLDLDPKAEKRLRRLPENTVFFEEELELKLNQLAFQDKVRLKLENGKFPQFGKMTIRVKNQSKFRKEGSKTEEDIICTPNELISQLKKKACDLFELETSKHSVYKTDWLGDPIFELRSTSKDDRSIQANQLKMTDIVILKDNHYDIPREMLNFYIYQTKTGLPNDSEYLDLLQISEFDTLENLKRKILTMPGLAEYAHLSPAQVRVREIGKDLFFESILRGEKTQLKKIQISHNSSVVVQILDHPENLEDDDMVLFIRKRIVDYKIYSEPREMLLIAGRYPQINDLKDAIIKFEGLDLDLQEIELVKYSPHEFEWLYISQEYIESENEKKKTGKKKKNQQKEEKLSLKSAPYFLRDGDVIGYRISFECIDMADDFQTLEDQENRIKFLQEKARGNNFDEDMRQALDKSIGGIHIGVGF